MEIIYICASAMLIICYLRYFLFKPRLAIVVGMIFTSFTRDALPWGILPHSDVAHYVQNGYLILASIYLLVNSKRAAQLKRLLNPYTTTLLGFWAITLAYVPLALPPETYGLSKTVIFLLTGVLPIVILSCIFEASDTPAIFFTIIVGSILMAIKLFVFGQIQATDLAGNVADPILIGRSIGVGLTLILLRMFVRPRLTLITMACYTIAMVFLLAGLLVNGERGPFLSCLLTVPIAALFLRRDMRNRIRHFANIILLGLIAVVIVIQVGARLEQTGGFHRISHSITTIGSNKSDQGRLYRYEVAWNGFKTSNGLGVGTGGFADLYGVEGRAYPHNVLLEVICEQGLIGELFLLLLFGMTISNIRKVCLQITDDRYKLALFLWTFFLFNALVSSDISGNNGLWVTGGFSWLLLRHTNRNLNVTANRFSRVEFSVG